MQEIKKAGFNSDYVEFYKDYGKSGSPFVKTYRCRKTDKKIAIISTIPRTNSKNEKIEAGFDFSDGKYVAKKNLFECEVSGSTVYLKEGRKTNKYNPQLFIDGIEQTGSFPTLKDDPYNEKYKNNFLEWTYPTAKRTIRIFEGRYRERWHFPKIDGKIEIKHNFKGTLKVNLGFAEDNDGLVEIAVKGDSEIFEGKAKNLVIGGTITFTADIDAWVARQDDPSTWEDLVSGAGTNLEETSSEANFAGLWASTTTDMWRYLYRSIFIFDTTSLAGRVESAIFSVYGTFKYDADSKSPDICVYAPNTASDSEIVDADYDTFSDTELSNVIDYADWSTSGYNDFTLNDSGVAEIKDSAVTKLGLRNKNYDADNSAPSWTSGTHPRIGGYYSEQGSGFEPKLTIVYREKTEYIPASSSIRNIINLSCPIDLE